jgi:cytochrome c oxidase assembly factor CtaG
LVIGLTLLSPLHHWSQASFTFHIIEHKLLYAAAALWLAFHWIGGDRRFGRETDKTPAD